MNFWLRNIVLGAILIGLAVALTLNQELMFSLTQDAADDITETTTQLDVKKSVPTSSDKKEKLVHEIDPLKFKYLLSGKSYFNFYLNVIYKYFHHDKDIFTETDYKNYFLECVNTARFLCKFDHIHKHIFFNFDDLIAIV